MNERLPDRVRAHLPTRFEAVVAVLAGLAAVVGSYVAAGFTPSFVVAPIDQQIVFMTPGEIVTYMIENVGEESHWIHRIMSAGIAVGSFGAITFGGLRLAERIDSRAAPLAGGLAAGVLAWGLAFVLTGEALLSVGPAAPVLIVTVAGRFKPAAPSPDAARRRALGTIATAVGFIAVGFGAGRWLHAGSEPLEDVSGAEDAAARRQAAEDTALDVASGDLPGMVSEIDNFYNVDIAEFDPEITKDEWSVTFTGDVDEELTLDYEDLQARDTEHRLITLNCIGEDLNGKKLDTAVWTGTPMRPILEEIDPEGNCDCVMMHGDDGYFIQYPIEVLETGFFAWGMNGKELPTAHGHPVRILIPGRWGETNVKWLTEVEVLNTEEQGYWEQRGWEGTGNVNTITKLWDDGITDLGGGAKELAGHAYAGTRGIQQVEVSVDGGSTWHEAELSDPLEDQDVWRMWRYTFEPSGSHEVVVRAIDGEGTLQTEERSSASPTGATGWVSKMVSE